MTSLVFLHGFTGTRAMWDGVRSALPPGALSLAPTLFGHGARGAQERHRSIEAEADRIALGARMLPSPRALCAYSLGARIGLTLLARHPSLFAAAVLVGVHPGLESPADRDTRISSDEEWAVLLERDGLATFVERWEAQPVLSAGSLPPAVRAAERDRRLSHTAVGLARSLRAHGLGRMFPVATKDVRARVTLMAGSLDTKFVALARELAPRLRHGRVVTVEGAGHNVPLARPDAVARALEESCR